MSVVRTRSKFTGRYMTAILVLGFGIVAAVNFTMASFATGGFHGVVVDNSYVASQEFNTWLEEAEADRALGWEAEAARGEAGAVELTTKAVPGGANVTAELRRPIGPQEQVSLRFVSVHDGKFRSTTPVGEGRWIIRTTIEADGETWSQESELR